MMKRINDLQIDVYYYDQCTDESEIEIENGQAKSFRAFVFDFGTWDEFLIKCKYGGAIMYLF